MSERHRRLHPPSALLCALVVCTLLGGTLAAGVIACGDDAGCSEEGAEEKGGQMCCNDGCGRTTVSPLPRICRKGQWKCQGSNPVELQYCATMAGSCQARTACTSEVGLDNDERDPAPELCCVGGCDGTEVVHRTCAKGTTYDCPSGAVEISRCPNPFGACGGAINRYRQNDNKLPLP